MAQNAATFFGALNFPGPMQGSQLSEQPNTLFSAQTAAGSNPVDTAPPPTLASTVGNGVSTDQALNPVGNYGNWTPPQGSIRCDGYRQIALSLEVFGSSGVQTATFRPYFFDGVRWCQGADTVVVTNSQTTSNPLARQRHDIYVEHDFGFCLVLEAISGTGASAAAYATRKDAIIGRK